MNNHYTVYETESRKQISIRTIWIILFGCLVFAAFNINLSSWYSVSAMLAATAVCLIALLANYKNHVTLANILVSASILLTITYSILDGDGLLDPGIVGYPLFILLGTLLLNKHYTPWLTLSSILALSFVGYMQAHGFLHLTIHPDSAGNLLPISIFLVIGGLIVWVILDSMQKNFDRLRNSEEELRKSYELTIQGLSKALDMRDVDTGGHSHRVVDLTEKVARAMGIDAETLQTMRYGAYLHDIGKLGIPDSILFKHGPLTQEEWKVMQTHTLLAEEMLASIPYLNSSIEIPKYHHEHWDGSGYPYRLKKEDIPLPARIFAVVDVWDALTNIRPYREAWSPEKTREYIAGLSEKQFDPQVVQTFLKIME